MAAQNFLSTLMRDIPKVMSILLRDIPKVMFNLMRDTTRVRFNLMRDTSKKCCHTSCMMTLGNVTAQHRSKRIKAFQDHCGFGVRVLVCCKSSLSVESIQIVAAALCSRKYSLCTNAPFPSPQCQCTQKTVLSQKVFKSLQDFISAGIEPRSPFQTVHLQCGVYKRLSTLCVHRMHTIHTYVAYTIRNTEYIHGCDQPAIMYGAYELNL